MLSADHVAESFTIALELRNAALRLRSAPLDAYRVVAVLERVAAVLERLASRQSELAEAADRERMPSLLQRPGRPASSMPLSLP
jgi:hypothetical protein